MSASTELFPELQAVGGDQATATPHRGILQDHPDKANSTAVSQSSAKKRSISETNDTEDDDGTRSDGEGYKWTCDQVRRRINHFLESGEMKVTEFQRTIGCNSKSYGAFMRYNGPWRGIDNSTMAGAYRFFRDREARGIAIPKKQKRETAVDLTGIHLEGEETDSVKIYDSCDEVRRKIAAHLRRPGNTQAQLLKDMAAQFHTQDVTIQSKQLNDFRNKKGPDAGNTSRVFYGAYCFFERLRLNQGKPKSKHRLDMEAAWPNGFDTRRVSRGLYCLKGDVPVMDNLGKVHMQRARK